MLAIVDTVLTFMCVFYIIDFIKPLVKSLNIRFFSYLTIVALLTASIFLDDQASTFVILIHTFVALIMTSAAWTIWKLLDKQEEKPEVK